MDIDSEHNPFGDVIDRRSIYLDGPRRRIQNDILSGIGRTDGLIFLSGEKGIGKTTMLRLLAEEIRTRADCHLLGSVPFLTCRQDMALRDLAEEFSYARYLARVADARPQQNVAAGVGGRAAILLDDAHRLSPKVLVQLRRWRKAFQIVRGRLSIVLTVGQEEGSPIMAALTGGAETGAQDMLKRPRPFNRIDVQRLIYHRLNLAGYPAATLFPPETVTRIFGHTRGNPAETLRLCRQALDLVPQGSGTVSTALVDAAAQGEMPVPRSVDGKIGLPPSSGFTLGGAPGSPCAPQSSEQAVIRTASLDRSSAFGAPARLVGLVAVATTALTVGWLYAAKRDYVENSVAALHDATSEGWSAALALVQPGREQEDLPVVPANLKDDLPPVQDKPVLLAKNQTQGQSDSDAVVPEESGTGDEQPIDEASPDFSDAEPSDLPAQSAPPVLAPEPAAADPESLDPPAEPAPSPSDPEPVADPKSLHLPAEPAPSPSDPEAAADPEPGISEGGPPAAGNDVPSEPPASVAGPGVNDLLDRGNRLLGLGDVAAARLFYRMASGRGSAEGALLMGLTFDPLYFEGRSIYGTQPHGYQAMEWYRKSAKMGNAEAQERMNALQLWLRRAAEEGDEDARRALQRLETQ